MRQLQHHQLCLTKLRSRLTNRPSARSKRTFDTHSHTNHYDAQSATKSTTCLLLPPVLAAGDERKERKRERKTVALCVDWKVCRQIFALTEWFLCLLHQLVPMSTTTTTTATAANLLSDRHTNPLLKQLKLRANFLCVFVGQRAQAAVSWARCVSNKNSI